MQQQKTSVVSRGQIIRVEVIDPRFDQGKAVPEDDWLLYCRIVWILNFGYFDPDICCYHPVALSILQINLLGYELDWIFF